MILCILIWDSRPSLRCFANWNHENWPFSSCVWETYTRSPWVGQMGPAPERFELSKCILKWTEAIVLGFETLNLKSCELKVRGRFELNRSNGSGIRDPQFKVLRIETARAFWIEQKQWFWDSRPSILCVCIHIYIYIYIHTGTIELMIYYYNMI